MQSFNLVTNDDYVMPSLGHMAVLADHPLSSRTDVSDRHIRRAGSDYAEFLPDDAAARAGMAEARARQHAGARVIGLCDYWGFVDGRAADLLERESDPRQTVELLPDWERNWGLPDPCYEEPQSIGERQLALVMRMTMLGSQSRRVLHRGRRDDRLLDHDHRVSHLRRRH